MAVYLLHFDRPYRHARHYLGFSDNVERRIEAHRKATAGDGRNHKLLVAIRDAGIGFVVARLWPNGTRADERRMKQRGQSRRCPICNPPKRKARA